MHTIQEKLLELHNVRKLSSLSYREIGRQISVNDHRVHPQTVKYHIDQLIKGGKLSEADRPVGVPLRPYKATSKPQLVRIPVMGAANAGPATMFADNNAEEYISVSSKLLRSKNFSKLIALRVEGNSMNLAKIDGLKIEDGDFVVVDRSRCTPRNDEIVIVNANNLVNIKRIIFDTRQRQVILRSESSDIFEPIYLSASDPVDAFIEGTVVQVMKSWKAKT